MYIRFTHVSVVRASYKQQHVLVRYKSITTRGREQTILVTDRRLFGVDLRIQTKQLVTLYSELQEKF